MRFSHLTSLTLLAASATAQYTNQSAPFQLSLQSSNETLNNALLTSCHEGAAIEGLCVSSYFTPALAPSTFNFNTSDNGFIANETLGQTGYLVWELRGGNFNESEAWGLTYNPSSNVAHPQFFPGNSQATLVAFDAEDKLNIQSYVDDSTIPATIANEAYYRWYACVTYTQGYTYQTVNWVQGEGEPQNPTCQKVDVVRKFV